MGGNCTYVTPRDQYTGRKVEDPEITKLIEEARAARALVAEGQAFVAKKVGINDEERSGILRSLTEGHDLTAWGILNAVTHQAHEAADYDRAVDFETMGGKLLNLPHSEWREVLEAA